MVSTTYRVILATALSLASPSSSPMAQPNPHSHAVVYLNSAYGMKVTLPASWKGYSARVATLAASNDGTPYTPSRDYVTVTLRHPLWTAENPREDLPIMIFTRRQWVLVEQEKLIVSAAPFPPGELARNRSYVFAIPPRYSNDELPGVEEVRAIVGGHPVQGLSPRPAHTQNKAK